MEAVLNLAWVWLAAVMLCIWLRLTPCTATGQRTQFVALALLILILFPVISVTDDLQAIQNPAEADCCLRRDHVVSSPSSAFSAVATLPPPAFAGLPCAFLLSTAHCSLTAPTIDEPALVTIQNRPPPV